jgi:hypothetical protein
LNGKSLCWIGDALMRPSLALRVSLVGHVIGRWHRPTWLP